MAWFPRSGSSSPTASRPRVEPRIRAVSPESPSFDLNNPPAEFLEWARGGSAGAFGPTVSEQSAMRVSTVYRCVSILSGLVASIPLRIYKRDPATGERTEAPDHKMARLFGMSPFPGRSMTAFSWRELIEMNTLLWGNHYSVIRYDGAGRVVGFEPVMPWNVQVLRNNNLSFYRCTFEDRHVEVIHQDDMLHIVGPGFDGVKGHSRIAHNARDAVSTAVILEQQTGIVHENASRPSGVVSVPNNITEAGFARMKADFAAANTGRANAGKVMFIGADQKYTPMQLTPSDLNTLEMRRYQSADICRFFGVPPHLVGEAAGTSAWGTGIEQLFIGFKITALDTEFTRIESEINMKLFATGPHFVEFDREALDAMDGKSSAEIRQTEINSGQLTPNEARRKMNRPHVEGGDELLVNSTMIPLSRALNPPAPAAPAAAPKAPAK